MVRLTYQRLTRDDKTSNDVLTLPSCAYLQLSYALHSSSIYVILALVSTAHLSQLTLVFLISVGIGLLRSHFRFSSAQSTTLVAVFIDSIFNKTSNFYCNNIDYIYASPYTARREILTLTFVCYSLSLTIDCLVISTALDSHTLI